MGRPEPTPTIGFDAYWRFASERQQVYLARLSGQTIALTADPVISQHRFTNAYRASDRVSQFLIRDVIYTPEDWNWEDTFTRVLIFKVFNKVRTWSELERRVGTIDASTITTDRLDRALSELSQDSRIYSAAYIMPPPRQFAGPKYGRHLELVRLMLRDGLPQKLANCKSMQGAFELLLAYPSIGPFLAYQFTVDLNYTEFLDFDERDFVVAGPGSARGLRKCFADSQGMSEVELFRWTYEQQASAFSQRGLDWHDLWGRELQLIDIQNLYCETDKYTRVAHPELSALAGGTRIKQKYVPNPDPMTAWFPPKWGINDRARSSSQSPQRVQAASAYGLDSSPK